MSASESFPQYYSRVVTNQSGVTLGTQNEATRCGSSIPASRGLILRTWIDYALVPFVLVHSIGESSENVKLEKEHNTPLEDLPMEQILASNYTSDSSVVA